MPKNTKSTRQSKAVHTASEFGVNPHGDPILFPQIVTENRHLPRDRKTGDVMWDDIDQARFPDYVITAPLAKEVLGWTPCPEGADDAIKDFMGNKVRLLKNLKNRPLYWDKVLELKQNILTRVWDFNGENIIITECGNVWNGQHTLLALILADQEFRLGSSRERWRAVWKDSLPVYDGLWIEKPIIYGIWEERHIFDTMDTARPRSVSDVIFTSGYFKKKKYSQTDMKNLSAMADWAVKLLWSRLGHGVDFFAPHRSNKLAVEFLDQHKKLVECVEYIYTLNQAGDGRKKDMVKDVIHTGYASACLYLMGCSSTAEAKAADYHAKRLAGKNPTEKLLNFQHMELAKEFFKDLVTANTDVWEAVRNYLTYTLVDDDTGTKPNNDTKVGVLAKAWSLFKEGGDVTEEEIMLSFKETPSGRQVLVEFPTFGGIDLGKVVKPKSEKEDTPEQSPEEDDETPEPVDESDLQDEPEVTEDVEEVDEVPEPAPKKKGRKKSKAV